MLHRGSYFVWGVFAVACVPPRPEPRPPVPSVARAAPAPAPARTVATAAPVEAAQAPAPATAPPPAPRRFPPPDVPLSGRASTVPGDGHFAPFAAAALGERAAVDPPVLVRTVLHPHPTSRWITVTLAALDLTRLRVGLVPGTEDLAWAQLPVTSDAGVVPQDQRPALVLVFNGGFQPKHGRWGLAANGVVVSRMREGGCTLFLDDSGAVHVAPYAELPEAARRATTFRQTPPCLVRGGAVHPSLLAGKDKPWAGHASDLQTRRRSAVGLDASGEVLFYAVGEEADPRWLAEALRLAGAADAAELDINWYWTRFLLFGKTGKEPLHVTSTLIPKMEHGETEYVSRPSTRDFFYVTLRPE